MKVPGIQLGIYSTIYSSDSWKIKFLLLTCIVYVSSHKRILLPLLSHLL